MLARRFKRAAGDSASVLVVDAEKGSRAVPILIGPEMDGAYPVFEGLQEGDQVVIR
jgi:hypothetical protein